MKLKELETIYKALVAFKKAARVTPASARKDLDQAIQDCKNAAARQNAYFSDESGNLMQPTNGKWRE